MSRSKDEVTSSSPAKPPTWRIIIEEVKFQSIFVKQLRTFDLQIYNPKKVHDVYGVMIDNRSAEKSKGSG